MMSKYGALRDLLQRRGRVAVELSFDEVADAVGGLPPSAYKHRAWWANNRDTHVQSSSWLDLGRQVEHVDLVAQRVRFSAPGGDMTGAEVPQIGVAPDSRHASSAPLSPPLPSTTASADSIDWASVWSATAHAMQRHVDEGRGHLLTEDVLRFALVLALNEAGVESSRMRAEYRVREIGASIDLAIDEPPTALIELKYPRDPEMQGAADTMTHGEILRDFFRLAWLSPRDAWAVLLLDSRLRRYLQRRSEVTWVFEPGETMQLRQSGIALLPRTASGVLPRWTSDMAVDAEVRTALAVGDSTLVSYRVLSATG